MRIRNLAIVALFGCILFVMPCTLSAQGTLAGSNNLKGSLISQDPSTVIKCNGVYYVFGSYGYLTSKDRITWSDNGVNPNTTQTWWAAHGGQRWAPEVACKNGVYYCYYSVSSNQNVNSVIALTTSPTLDTTAANYTWTDQGIIIDSAQANKGTGKVNCIDPYTFTDDDGKWYMAFGSWFGGLRMVELDTTNGKLLNSNPTPTRIFVGKTSGTGGEGSAVGHWKNYYYYALSQGACCTKMDATYYISYARATSVIGPYTTKNGGSFQTGNVEKLLYGSNNAKATSGVVAVGVSGFFWDGSATLDTLFLDYMAYTAPTGDPLLNIKPLYADASGWLTLDPSAGTVITRMPPATAVNHGDKAIMGKVPFKGCIARAITGPKAMAGEFYSLTGQKLTRNSVNRLATGLVVQKISPTKFKHP